MGWLRTRIGAIVASVRPHTDMIDAAAALPGRPESIMKPRPHFVNASPIAPPFRDGLQTAVFGQGCFWGAERGFWELDGVDATAAGYAGGYTPNPTYHEVCAGRTGHTEAVLVIFDPQRVSYPQLLSHFWESHDPTQGMRQGNDRGTQYRSAIYATDDAQLRWARASAVDYGDELATNGYGPITTETARLVEFYYAEDYHQQYLAKNPNGYCGIGGTGVACPVGIGARPDS